MWTSNFVILIPFKHTEDVDKFARDYNVKNYTGVYLPSRGKEHPKKFVIIIENWDIENMPKGMWQSFYHQRWDYGYSADNVKELKEIVNDTKKHWDNPYVYRKLTNGKYICFSANIKDPLLIYI